MTIRNEIMAALGTMRAEDFLSAHMFDRISHIFAGNRELFIARREALSRAIEVDPACISFVGSSAVGVSLNPSSGFKMFDADSDIDVGIISHYHFTVSWRYLRTQGHRRMEGFRSERSGGMGLTVTSLFIWARLYG